MIRHTLEPGDTIIIGDNIRVVIMGIKGCQVRFGIEAPRDVEVDRLEIRKRKEPEFKIA